MRGVLPGVSLVGRGAILVECVLPLPLPAPFEQHIRYDIILTVPISISRTRAAAEVPGKNKSLICIIHSKAR